MITLINTPDYSVALKKCIEIFDNDYIQLDLEDEESVFTFFSNNSLFQKNNNVIISNINAFCQTMNNEKIQLIIHYINFFHGNIVLINIDEKITLSNLFKIKINNTILIPKIGIWNIRDIIEKELEKQNLFFEKKTLEYFSIIIDFNYGIIENEIKKLSLLNKPVITINDLKNVCSFSNNDSIFKIVEYYLKLENNKAFELMEFFLKNNTNIDHLFAMLVTQLFKVKIYCVHYKNNHSFTKLMNDYKLKNFQIKHLEKFIKNEPITSIDKILDDLYKIDLKTKKNFIDKHHLITLFLLKKYNH